VKQLLLVYCLLNVLSVFAQDTLDTMLHVPAYEKEPFFHRSHHFYIGCERMPVIVGELRLGQSSMAAGGGIAISGGNSGCMGGANSGIGIGCLYEWGTKTTIPSIDVWAHTYFAFMGPTLRFKAQYLINENYRLFALQPQAGLGCVRVHFMYGHNFYVKHPDGVNLVRNCFSVWFNIPTMQDKADLVGVDHN
jgi:hypothetical protein